MLPLSSPERLKGTIKERRQKWLVNMRREQTNTTVGNAPSQNYCSTCSDQENRRGNMDSTKRNGAGYYDPTAFQAIKNTEKGAKKNNGNI